MRLPAARDHRCLWLAVAFTMVLAMLPAIVFAQETPTTTPMTGGGAVVALPPVQFAENATSNVCPTAGQSGLAAADSPITDYAIVLDVSRSMIGYYQNPDGSDGIDPARNIFPLVKEAVVGYIGSLKPEANIILIPFADGVRENGIVRIDGQRATSTDEAIKAVNGSVADGLGTYITQAVERAIDELESLKNSTPGQARYQTILLYTDGQGNGPGDTIDDNGVDPSVDQMLDRINAYRTDQPFLFVKYVALGLQVPNKDQLEADQVTVIEEPTGRVSPIREVSLSLLGRDLGTVNPGEITATTLCMTGGASVGELPVSLSLSGVNGDVPPIWLTTESALLTPSGAEVNWQIPDDGGAAPGDYVGFLEIRDEDPELLLLPERLPVTFQIPLPPTFTPTSTPSPSPLPTATATPSPTIAPTETPTPTPSPTSTPVPGASISLGNFDGPVKVSLKDGPDTQVKWSAPLTFDLQPGAAPVVSVEDLVGEPRLNTPIDAHFEVDGVDRGEQIELRNGMGETRVVLVTTAGNLQQLGEIDPAKFQGLVSVDPRSSAVTLPKGACQTGTECALPFTAEAKVYTPVNWGPILLGLLAVLAAGVATGAAWAARPVLPKNAAVLTGSGIHARPMMLGDHQTGFAPKGVSIGGNGSMVNVGSGPQIGEIHGKWGIPHRAFLTVDGSASGVRVDNQPVQPDGTVQLGEGSQIKMGNRTFRYSQEPRN